MNMAIKPIGTYQNRIVTIPNIITGFRILLLPFFIYYARAYALQPANRTFLTITMLITAMAIFSDFFDGYLARALQQESNFGRYLDPVSDKIVTIGGLSTLVKYYELPVWILVIYIIREILGIWLGSFLLWKRQVLARPNLWGKTGVFLVAVTIIAYLNFYPKNSLVFYPILSAYTLLTVLSIGIYVYAKTYWNIVFYPNKIISN